MLGMRALFGLAVLVALVFVMRREHRELARAGKGRSWLIVRLGALPVALLTAATVWLPARAVSGPEALAVLYVLLLGVAPLVWIGAHVLLGRAISPALSFAESLQLALALPTFGIAAALVGEQLQPLGWSIAQTGQRAAYGVATEAEPRHELAAARRWVTPAGDVLVARWQAPPDVHVERIDLVVGTLLEKDAGLQEADRLCQAPGAIVLLWLPDESETSLRVYWRDGAAHLRVSSLTPPAPGAAVPFGVAWRGETGFTLPEPLPRQILWVRYEHDPPARFGSSEAQQYRPGERPEMSCLATWQARFPIAGLRVRVENHPGSAPRWLEALRTMPGAGGGEAGERAS